MQEGPGFFGKLPSRGDFVNRRLPAGFLAGWDAWLQSALSASRAALGGQWLEVYLTSPMWRFALSPGVCGEDGCLGVVMPSVDKVGRYFPLTVALSCGPKSVPSTLAAELDDWYDEAESLLLATLAETPLEVEAFDERLAGLIPRRSIAVTDAAADGGTLPCMGGERLQRHWAVPSADGIGGSMRLLCSDLLGRCLGPCSVWWTQGSERVEPCVLVASALPTPEAYVAMLDGRWSERAWMSGTLHRESPGPATGRALPHRSAGVSDPGKVRAVNEDAYLCRDELGLWLVADGLGGHEAGDVASRMVASAAAQLPAWADLTAGIAQLQGALAIVNGCLRVLAERSPSAGLTASTVVALVVDGCTAACAWAGDSRIYRWRDGEVRLLSRDHAEAGGSADSHAVTRAVGGDEELLLDIERFDLLPGDRFLLCTDGLYSEVRADDIGSALALADPEQACAQLRRAALAGVAPDNLTAVVVHVARSAATSGGWLP